jgi:hypothetical protein
MNDKPLSDGQLRALTDYELRSRAERTLRRLRNRPEGPRKKILRQLKESICWKLPLDHDGQYHRTDGSLLMVDVREYEPDIYRLHIGAPVSYGGRYCFSELTFVPSDLEHINGIDLARFLEAGGAYSLPLFSHDPSYPAYAWTKAANTFYQRRHQERLQYEKELMRRRRERDASR